MEWWICTKDAQLQHGKVLIHLCGHWKKTDSQRRWVGWLFFWWFRLRTLVCMCVRARMFGSTLPVDVQFIRVSVSLCHPHTHADASAAAHRHTYPRLHIHSRQYYQQGTTFQDNLRGDLSFWSFWSSKTRAHTHRHSLTHTRTHTQVQSVTRFTAVSLALRSCLWCWTTQQTVSVSLSLSLSVSLSLFIFACKLCWNCYTQWTRVTQIIQSRPSDLQEALWI